MHKMVVDVIIPAINEEKSIHKVIDDIPKELVRDILVIDNGSSDKTVDMALGSGAIVLTEKRRGYGSACLKGMSYIAQHELKPDVVVFIDADYSDFPGEMPLLLEPISEGDLDMVIGSRAIGKRERGSMTFPQKFGNWLATKLMNRLYGIQFTDLGPFRAIKYESLLKLNMMDTNYGWTVEMQLKAGKNRMNCTEVPVSYRKRIGKSKVSGTVSGTIMAGYKILWTIFRYT